MNKKKKLIKVHEWILSALTARNALLKFSKKIVFLKKLQP